MIEDYCYILLTSSLNFQASLLFPPLSPPPVAFVVVAIGTRCISIIISLLFSSFILIILWSSEVVTPEVASCARSDIDYLCIVCILIYFIREICSKRNMCFCILGFVLASKSIEIDLIYAKCFHMSWHMSRLFVS